MYWGIVICLFSTLPLSVMFTLTGLLFGCQNAFELGCPSNPVGAFFGNAGLLLGFLTFITYPAGALLGLIGIITAFASSTKKMYEEPDPNKKVAQKKSLLIAAGCIFLVFLTLFGIPWVVNNL